MAVGPIRAQYRDNAKVKGFEVRDGRVEVHAVSPVNESSGFACKYLVGADGNNSTVRRLLTAQAREQAKPLKLASFQSYYEVASLGSLMQDSWNVFLMPDIGDYILCVHQKGQYLVMHVGGFKGRNLRRSMQQFREFLSDRFAVRFGAHWRDEGCLCQLLPIFLGKGRVLLTGEAAGFIYLNCEGISAAMDSGHRCGKALVRALRSEGEDACGLYAERCRDVRAHVDKCMSQMRFLAASPPSQ